MDCAPPIASGRIFALCGRNLTRWGPDRAVSRSRRKLQPESRAHANRALHMHLARMFLHDAIADREAQPGALVLALARLGLGGEERIEDAMQMFRLNASAEILHHDGDVSRRLLRGNPNPRVD